MELMKKVEKGEANSSDLFKFVDGIAKLYIYRGSIKFNKQIGIQNHSKKIRNGFIRSQSE